jgi:formate dehydrogenase gamma subunit
VNLIKDHNVLRDEPIKLYEGSVHGWVPEDGSCAAATCTDCHSANGEDGQPTAHRILSAAEPESTVHRFMVPATCGKCHRSAAEDYRAGIHGQLTERGEMDAPVCTHCHGEHGILPVSDLRSPVSAARLAEATCAPCHESVALNERYGIPAGRLKSYVDSYHGHKRKAGEVHVANCASCHGSHRILAHTDPRSSIYPANLQNTCGQCHPGISGVLAQTPIHVPGAGTDRGWPHFFTVVYKWLIGVTIGLMLLHNMAHWFRHVKLRSKAKQVVRLTASEVAQHWILMLSFTVLVISGFSLRFSDAWWVQLLFGWGGGAGFVIRGTIHRVAAVVFMIWAIWHVFYLCTRRGRQWLRDMMVSKGDLLDIKGNALFFLGRRDAQPRFGRFSYMEKSEYWALMWGAVVMAATGVLLWFENYFIEDWNVSKILLDVSLVIHYYEAWLATLAILVWHVYATVFSPSVYPMNPAWWAGKMPKDLYDEEHPEGPKLSAVIDRPAAHEGEESEEVARGEGDME